MAKYRIVELHPSRDYRYCIEEDLSAFKGFFGYNWWPIELFETKEEAKKRVEELTYVPKVIAEYGT